MRKPRASGVGVASDGPFIANALLPQPAVQDGLIGIDAPVAQERPIAPCVLDAVRVAFDNENLLFVGRSLRRDLPKRIGNERISPELDAALGRAFIADAIHRRDVYAVGDGVRALDGAPGVELRRAKLLLFPRMPADSRRIEKNLRALQARQPRAFRIPLVPADQDADVAI